MPRLVPVASGWPGGCAGPRRPPRRPDADAIARDYAGLHRACDPLVGRGALAYLRGGRQPRLDRELPPFPSAEDLRALSARYLALAERVERLNAEKFECGARSAEPLFGALKKWLPARLPALQFEGMPLWAAEKRPPPFGALLQRHVAYLTNPLSSAAHPRGEEPPTDFSWSAALSLDACAVSFALTGGPRLAPSAARQQAAGALSAAAAAAALGAVHAPTAAEAAAALAAFEAVRPAFEALTAALCGA